MTTETNTEKAARFFQALSSPKRVRIVEALQDGEKCVSKMNELLQYAQPNLSQHLTVLRQAGILKCEKKGNLRCYCLTDASTIEIVLRLVKNFCEDDS
ncbi:MAG: metalloregulator ArsR/SmtB family transcription factor [Planctomycetota bacterium]|nr:metalloregulator ArsR/SmtB family transcription factor [Planctomycetota bacterium]